MSVGLHHAVRIEAQAGLAIRLLFQMREDVHARRIEVAEPRRLLGVLALDEVDRRRQKLLVDRFHALGIERAGILDDLLADTSKSGVDPRVVAVARLAFENAAWAEFRAEARVFRI